MGWVVVIWDRKSGRKPVISNSERFGKDEERKRMMGLSLL